MIQSISAGGIILNNGRVVVVNQGGDSWSFPKGHIEKGESPLQAALREIYEECGLKNIDFVKELGSYKRNKPTKYKGKKEMKTIHMFLFKTLEEKLQPKDRAIKKAVWIEKEKAVEMLRNENDKEFLSKVMEEIQ
jgi:8-oxo-dGTP diphosphatase